MCMSRPDNAVLIAILIAVGVNLLCCSQEPQECQHIWINLQSLEDTQVGYISQKYTLDKYTLEKYT